METVTKPWFASKTIWVNAVAFIAAITAGLGLDLGLTPETQASIVGGILAVINIYLRTVTDTPLRK